MATRLELLQQQLDELLAVRAAEHGEFLGLADQEEDLNDAQQARWAELTERFDKSGRHTSDDQADVLRKQVELLVAVRDAPAPARVEIPEPSAARGGSGPTLVRRNDSDPYERGAELGTADQVRDTARRAVEKTDGIDDRQRARVDSLLRSVDTPDRRLARHIIATGRADYRTAFGKIVGGFPELMTEAEREAAHHARAMSLTDAAGGYAVPFVLDPTVINTGAHPGVNNPWRDLARVVTTISDNWNGVSSDGVTAFMAGEAEEATDGAPTFAQPTIPVKKAQALVPFSIEIGMDFANLEGEIRSMFAMAKDNLEDTQFALGSGAGNNVNGVVTDTVAAGSDYIQTSATADTFAAADVYAVEEKLAQRFRAGASFVANHATYNKVRQFDTQGGAQLWERIGAGLPPQLLGYPVYESNAVDGVIDAGAENYLIVFGNIAQAYTVVDRLGATVELIPHLMGATNNLPTGQRALYFYWRFGAAVTNQRAVVVLNVT